MQQEHHHVEANCGRWMQNRTFTRSEYAYYPTASPSAILLGKRSLTSTMRRVGPGSRNTLHLLRWTAQTQRYTLTLGTQTLPSEITSGNKVWTQWLATVSSLPFEVRSGIHSTVGKELFHRDQAY